MRCPCKGCTDRTITCHSVCNKYIDWKKNKDEENNWLIRQRPIMSEDGKKRLEKQMRRKARGWIRNGGGRSGDT